jgi:integrase
MPRTRNSRSIYDRFDRYVDTTFGEAAARYLAEFDGKDKRRVAAAIESTLPYIGHLTLIDVDDEALGQFKEDRRLGRPPFKKPAMVGTINKELTQVATVIGKACRIWRMLPSVPKFVHVRGPVKQAYTFNWEEQDRLFSQLPTGWDTGSAVFAVNTGARKEEIFGLKWVDRRFVPELDIKNQDGTVKERMFVFVLGETKNGEQRALICNSYARNAVYAQFKWQMKFNGGLSDYVFPSMRRGFKGSRCVGSGAAWAEAWKRAGLPSGPLVKKGIHCCRHVYAYRLRVAGVPQEDRNALLGHARTNLAEHYATPDIERLLAYAERVTVRRETTVLHAVRA